eukprot:713997-Rhodomonas_salina.1
MQSYAVSATSSTSGTTNDSNTYAMEMLKNTCTRVARHLCDLLQQAYVKSYDESPHPRDGAVEDQGQPKHTHTNKGKQSAPVFHISCNPVLPLADIVELHFRQIIDDNGISEMLLQSVGFPLDKDAVRLPWNKT